MIGYISLSIISLVTLFSVALYDGGNGSGFSGYGQMMMGALLLLITPFITGVMALISILMKEKPVFIGWLSLLMSIAVFCLRKLIFTS